MRLNNFSSSSYLSKFLPVASASTAGLKGASSCKDEGIGADNEKLVIRSNGNLAATVSEDTRCYHDFTTTLN